MTPLRRVPFLYVVTFTDGRVERSIFWARTPEEALELAREWLQTIEDDEVRA